MEFWKSPWRLLPLIGVLLGVLAALLLLRSRGSAPAATQEPTADPAGPVAAAPPAVPSRESGEAPAAPAPAPSAAAPAAPDPEAVRALFADFVREQPGRWSLCYARLPDGETVSCATDEEPMVSASLVKLFILGAVCQRIEQGELRWEDAETRLRAMITVSDNASANELIRLLGGGDAETGMAAVNAWCADLAYADTRLNRLMLADNGLQNYTGAADCAAFLTAVYRGECVSPEASRRMLALLREQTVNDRLPALLPAGTAVAHKTGDLSGLCCADVGIVFSPGGDYLLCVICNDQPYDAAAREAIAALSAQVYALVNP